MTLLVALGLGWVSGIWAASQFSQPSWTWLLLAVVAAVALVTRRIAVGSAWRLLLAGAIAFGLGGVRYQLAQPPAGDRAVLSTYNGTLDAALEGIVSDEPDVRDTRTHLRVRVDTLRLPDAPAPISVDGLVLVYAPRFSHSRLTTTGDGDFHYGDRLRILGALETPPTLGDFSYRDYLARSGVYSQVRLPHVTFLAERQADPAWQALFDFKARALATIARIFPEPDASLLSGILLGVESGIPKDLKEAFNATGTSHIIAISGFNIAILAGILTAVAGRLFGARRGAVIAILGIAVYTVLVGAGASVVRAAIMGSLAIVAGRIGRRSYGVNTLAAAVIAMTLINPLTLWDVGFQLSAAATLGLVLYVEPFETTFKNLIGRITTQEAAELSASLASEPLLVSLAAQLTTLPLIAYYFKRLSLISPLANLVILPAQPALMVTAGIALVAGLIAVPVGRLLAWIAWPFSAYTLAFVEFFAGFPAASLSLGEVAPWVVLGFYAALFGLTWMFSQPPAQRPAWWGQFAARRAPALGLAGLALGTLVAWSWYFSLPERDGHLRITVLDVGQGDGILIQTPSGATALIDGGPSGRALARALAGALPPFTTDLDLLVIASPRDENIGSLPDALARYTVRRALVTRATGRTAAYRAVMEMMNSQGIQTVSAAGLPELDMGDGIRLRVLYDDEETGSVLRLEWNRASLMLPIGLDVEGETALLAHGLAHPSTALLLADHGSDQATHDDWVLAVDPQVVFISVSAGNPEGDPSPDVLRRLAGRTILQTDERGDLTLVTDGQQFWLETER